MYSVSLPVTKEFKKIQSELLEGCDVCSSEKIPCDKCYNKYIKSKAKLKKFGKLFKTKENKCY